jgi:hypothetical protein
MRKSGASGGKYVMLPLLRHRFVVSYSERRSVPQLLCYIRHLMHSGRQQCEQTASAEPPHKAHVGHISIRNRLNSSYIRPSLVQ